jgi:type IV pilus assembly protein PilW
MTHSVRRHTLRGHTAGLTLIEMLVSITIGMIVVIAIVAMYAGASNASKTAEAQGRMNEDAQAALSILTQQIRMAGTNPKQPNRIDATVRNPVFTAASYSLRGCEGRFSDVTSAANPQSLTCAAGTSTLPDSLVVSYEADRYNTVPTPTGKVPTDCAGSGLTTVTQAITVASVPGPGTATGTVTYWVADNRFYISTTTAISAPNLYCKGSNTLLGQPLVENIEDLQFLYGTSPAATATGTVGGYLDANGVETDATTDANVTTALSSLASSQARWARVLTVRICVLVRSELPVTLETNVLKYIDCNGTLVTPSDRRLRKAFHTTVVLRNRV